MTFEEAFKQIDQTKDKYSISNLLGQLKSLEPDESFIERIKKLSLHRTSQIRWSALGLLSNYVLPNLEDFFIEIINSNIDAISVSHSVHGLSLNGGNKSVEVLIETFNKSRDPNVRGSIINGLRGVYLRNNISQDSKKSIFNLIGNKYPFFQGFWNDLKSAELSTSKNWKDLALHQLSNNILNIVYLYNDQIDFHLHIEKMNLHFIRSINATAIYKNTTYSFSKFYTPEEFCLSENMLFDAVFEKTGSMRLDTNKEIIIELFEINLIPKLIEKQKLWSNLEAMPFSEFEKNSDPIFKSLYGTTMNLAIAHNLTTAIYRFKYNPDINLYVDFVLQKWESCNKQVFAITNFLKEQKNSR